MNTGWIDPALLRDFQSEGTDSHRLCTVEDGWVERFGSDVLISFKRMLARERLLKELQTWADSVGFPVQRVFARFIPTKNERRKPPALVVGDPGESLQTVATEWYLRFGIDFGTGYSPGLFLDQRENRRYVRHITPKRLLNCFAYTCSFSVYAACNGGSTLNVDVSKKYLARGRENFALNNLSTVDHRFITDNVRSVLPRLARRGEKFDAIILDPPTFSRSPKGKTFQIQHDFENLLISALAVAERDAHVLVSTNCSALGERALEVMARYCLKETRRAATFHRPLPLPDFPPRTGASSLWLALR
ncbi:MAG TPA: class I SAM-dependent methyltransferase [Candidatus Tectomicrobia bacterium]|jgi:23S rRNA (cytosine1962-C5)-methyltransferase|nr:class I SAM-dependent methyltransferase [Candidatus Tectomicrobia bacterium]